MISEILSHPLGVCVGTHAQVIACKGYNFWSGIGSDLGEITLLAAVIGLYKHINCEEPHCPWMGHRHPDHGRPVCRKHYHTHVPPQPPKRPHMPLETIGETTEANGGW